MPKKKNKVTLEEKIMSKIRSERIKMKPRWYFLVGSTMLFVSLVVLSVGVMFLINLMFFALRTQGPMVGWRLTMILAHFPWWGLGLSLLGMVVGVKLLKRYDFSYKKNFNLVVVIFVLTMLVAGLLFDRIGLNERLMRRRPMMRRFYQNVGPGRLNRRFTSTTYTTPWFKIGGRSGIMR